MSDLKIVCCVKQTFSTDSVIRLDQDGAVSTDRIKYIVNPYDEFSVEEALRIKERQGAEVVILMVGGEGAGEQIRQCLAMGADRAVRVDDSELPERDEAATANLLAAALGTMEYDLIFCGKTAVDSNASEVPMRLAEALNLPQAGVISKLELEDGMARARADGDGFTATIEIPLPALVTSEKSLNTPRYPSLPNIMKAKKKPIDVLALSDLGLSAGDPRLAPTRRRVEVKLPPTRQGAKIIEGTPQEAASELARLLRDEAKVI